MVSSNSFWRVMGASVPGTSHLRSGRGCDDAHDMRLHDGGLLLLAVADGAGSAAYSAAGAATAVRIALDTAELLLKGQMQPGQEDQWLSVLRMVLQSAREAVHQLVLEKIAVPQNIPQEQQPYQLDGKRTLRDFATTLLVAIITPDWIATVQVGDGAIVIQQTNGGFTSLTPRSRNEYVNETDFITDTGYLSAADFTVLPRRDMRGIALLTDGLQTVAMKVPQNIPSAPFFTPLFRVIARSAATEDALRRFLASERICARTDDDKTLILAVPL
ncbi:MAG: PP2C family serine/threonine-protein phosphatase [Ktedonobacteraceae bacterium]